jgi:KaiC/GvpD/RAD55 family RecA-like ATPase
MKLMKTGVAGLDEFLQGGLPPKVILLIGPPGSGNEVFARQIIYNKSKQEKITYYTVNSNPECVKAEMASYGWDITQSIENGNLKFKSLTLNSTVNEIVGEIAAGRSVVVDSFSEFLLMHNTQQAIDLILAMNNQNLTAQQYHILLLTEGMHNPQTEILMQHYCEGVITFFSTWNADFVSRYLIVKKMAGSLSPVRRLPYAIGKKGFVIETATRIT